MKSYPNSCLLLSVAALTVGMSYSGPLLAQGLAGRTYVAVDGGVSFLQDTKISNFDADKFHPEIPGVKTGHHAEWEPGMRFGLHGGRFLSDAWAVEVEAAMIWNSADKFLGRKPGSQSSGETEEVTLISQWYQDVDLFQVPFLANVIYRVPLHGPVTPYVGAGLGLSISTLSLGKSSVSTISDEIDEVNTLKEDSGADIAFACQGMAGVRYSLSRQIALDLTYKFFYSTGLEWHVHQDSFKASPILNHALLASFHLRF